MLTGPERHRVLQRRSGSRREEAVRHRPRDAHPAAQGAVVEGQTLDEEGVKRLATLPSREVLNGQVVSVIAAPLQTFVNVLAAAPREFVVVLDQIIQKKQAEAA